MRFNTTLSLLLLFTFSISIFASQATAQEETETKPFADKMLPALFNKQIQAELELVENQKSELKTLMDELQERRKQLGSELAEFKRSGASPSELDARRMEIVEGFETEKTTALSNLMNVLLPHQKKRLGQATAQYMMRELAKSKKLPTGILAPEIRKYLEIDDAQAEKIKNRASEIQKELAAKIKKLTEQAQAQLMNELTQTQKSKLDELIGERIN